MLWICWQKGEENIFSEIRNLSGRDINWMAIVPNRLIGSGSIQLHTVYIWLGHCPLSGLLSPVDPKHSAAPLTMEAANRTCTARPAKNTQRGCPYRLQLSHAGWAPGRKASKPPLYGTQFKLSAVYHQGTVEDVEKWAETSVCSSHQWIDRKSCPNSHSLAGLTHSPTHTLLSLNVAFTSVLADKP